MMIHRTTAANLVQRHVKLNAAQRVLEMYSAGEPYTQFLHDMPPEMRRSVEGLLRAAAESWGNAVSTLEQRENNDGHWLY